MNTSFINKFSALAITSLVLVIGLVLLKTASLPEVTTPYGEEIELTIYEDLN